MADQQITSTNVKNKDKQNRKGKRDLITLIDLFYEYLSRHDEVFLSSFRFIEDPEKRIQYPTNKRILEIIQAIQDRPYIYIKKPNSHSTILKLSSHPRDPKIRYPQLTPLLNKIKEQANILKEKVQRSKESEYIFRIEQYQTLIEMIIQELERLRDRERDYNPKEEE